MEEISYAGNTRLNRKPEEDRCVAFVVIKPLSSVNEIEEQIVCNLQKQANVDFQ